MIFDGLLFFVVLRFGFLWRLFGKVWVFFFCGFDSVVKDCFCLFIFNSFLWGLLSCGGVVSVDEIGRLGIVWLNKLICIMFGFFVLGCLGGFFCCFSSSLKKLCDDGGINGNWGVDIDEDVIYDDEILC